MKGLVSKTSLAAAITLALLLVSAPDGWAKGDDAPSEFKEPAPLIVAPEEPQIALELTIPGSGMVMVDPGLEFGAESPPSVDEKAYGHSTEVPVSETVFGLVGGGTGTASVVNPTLPVINIPTDSGTNFVNPGQSTPVRVVLPGLVHIQTFPTAGTPTSDNSGGFVSIGSSSAAGITVDKDNNIVLVPAAAEPIVTIAPAVKVANELRNNSIHVEVLYSAETSIEDLMNTAISQF